jgi:glycosyltransferase involved in cell wall biosynthesis
MQVTNKKYDQKNKISIGIPTYEAGESLVAVVKSISTQTCYSEIDKILIAVDGNSIPQKILRHLTDKKIKIVYFKNRKGQSTRINNIFKLLNTKKIVLTNDDVILKKNALEFIQKKYKKYDLIAGNVKAFS